MLKQASLIALALALPLTAQAQTEVASGGRVIEVRMVDKSLTEYAFEPATITVRRGDVVRFIQTSSTMPHNVEFKGPLAASLGAARSGPLLMTLNQVYEVTIDGRFPEGTHPFVCTPHEAMGMRGVLTVAAPAAPTR